MTTDLNELLAEIRRETGLDIPVEDEPIEATVPTRGKHRSLDFKERKKRISPSVVPRPGEVTMGEYISMVAKKWGVTNITAYHRLWNKQFRGLKIRRVNARVVFVKLSGSAKTNTVAGLASSSLSLEVAAACRA